MKIQLDKNFITDSSLECEKGSFFLKTAQNLQYEQEALKKGAKVISVAECLKILNINPNIKIVGITGTNGKTTTAAAIYSALLDLGYNAALQGTRGAFVNDKQIENKSLTTPPAIQTLSNLKKADEKKCDFFVMEVSSHAISQNRIEGLKFALKIFTNISQDHLDYHKNMQEYSRVKSSFFQDESLKLINNDDIISYNPKNSYTYATDKPANFKVNVYSLKNGIEAVIKNKDQIWQFHSMLRGSFNLQNLNAAISALALITNKSSEDISRAIEGFGGVKGRMQIVSQKPLVIVDFAHTPDGMEKTLDAMKNPNLVIVFGAGGDRDKSKRPIMGKIAKRFGKKVYITSDNPRSEEPNEIIKDIEAGISDMQNVFKEADRKKAIHLALQNLEQNEILMILGKGDEDYQEINGKKYPFDDAKIVENFLNKR